MPYGHFILVGTLLSLLPQPVCNFSIVAVRDADSNIKHNLRISPGEGFFLPNHQSESLGIESRTSVDVEKVNARVKPNPRCQCRCSGHECEGLFFTSAFVRSGIRDVHIHDLRHALASWLVRNGTPLIEISRLLRHASITMTERYAHLAPDHLHQAVENLGFTAQSQRSAESAKPAVLKMA